MKKEVMVYMARVTRGMVGGLIPRNPEGFEQLNGNQTRFVCFPVEEGGHCPETVVIWEQSDSATFGYARERLFIESNGEKMPCIGFLADGNAALEMEQLSLASRISSLFLLSREEWAAFPDMELEVLARGMTAKGVALVCDGWCDEHEFADDAFLERFREVAEHLNAKRPITVYAGIVQ